jgi:SNF2 family DNA or RNA helicase
LDDNGAVTQKMQNKNKVDKNEKKNPTKMDQLIQIIKENLTGTHKVVSSGASTSTHEVVTTPNPKKILVFSSFDNALESIGKLFAENGVSYEVLKGQSGRIKRLCDEFKNSAEHKILLMNSTYCGSGLNLENTTDIIMMHKFVSETEEQIIGRAQRPGRTCSLNVHYLVHENEC